MIKDATWWKEYRAKNQDKVRLKDRARYARATEIKRNEAVEAPELQPATGTIPTTATHGIALKAPMRCMSSHCKSYDTHAVEVHGMRAFMCPAHSVGMESWKAAPATVSHNPQLSPHIPATGCMFCGDPESKLHQRAGFKGYLCFRHSFE